MTPPENFLFIFFSNCSKIEQYNSSNWMSFKQNMAMLMMLMMLMILPRFYWFSTTSAVLFIRKGNRDIMSLSNKYTTTYESSMARFASGYPDSISHCPYRLYWATICFVFMSASRYLHFSLVSYNGSQLVFIIFCSFIYFLFQNLSKLELLWINFD